MIHPFFDQNKKHKKALAALVAVLICILIPSSNSYAQTISQRFFMDMGASVNVPNGPASFSIAAEPKFWLFNYVYLGLKIDAPIGSFGDNSDYDLGLNNVEPRMGAVSSLMLSGYVEQHFCYSKLFIGYGLGRFFSNDIHGTGFLSPSSMPVSSIDTVRLSSAWGRQLTIGVSGENLYLSISFKKPFSGEEYLRMPTFTSTTLGIEFGNGKHLTKFRNNDEYQRPPIMFEFGQQLAVPIGKSPAAVGRALYAEFRVGIKERFSIGARLLDFPRDGYGTDTDGYPIELRQQLPGISYLNFGRINTMRLVRSNTLFVDYYFSQKNGWVNIGIGSGWYRYDGLETIKFNGTAIPDVPGIPEASSMGAILRVGHKTGFFRSGLDLNLTSNGVPSYASFHVGIEPGFYIYRNKDGG